MNNTRTIIVDTVEMIPGKTPDGTLVGKFHIETSNLGNLDWYLTLRQALVVAQRLTEYAADSQPKRRRSC